MATIGSIAEPKPMVRLRFVPRLIEGKTLPSVVARPTLLVVDDDDFLREAVAFILSCEGYEIVLASSGEEALALIAAVGSFDGLYTDIDLSGTVDGWEVGEAFYRKWPTRPIFYASAHVSADARIMPTGKFMEKPFDLEELITILIG